MMDVDFLPSTYHEERVRQARRYQRWVVIFLFVVTLVGWGIARQQQSAKLAWRADSLESQAYSTRLTQSEMDKLRSEKTSLVYQIKIQKQLDQPVAVTQAVSVLGQLLPEASGLTRVQIQTHRPPPIPLEDPDKKKKSNRKTAVKPVPVKDYLEVNVYGIAPDDVAVAQFMNAMSDHPLFEKVTMHFSRTEEREDIISRQFHIGARIPLDRQYLPTQQTAEVPHED